MRKIFIVWNCFVFFLTTGSAQIQENWSRFRGPNGQGISKATQLPITWSEDENIVWKTDIPGEGWSSPVVWNNHIFLTTATEDGKNCHVIAVDRKTGAILWNKMVFTQEAEQHRHPMNSYATPTPVTDGKTVYAVFSGGNIVALDFEGHIRWINSDLNFYSQHNMGTSPVLYDDLLVLAVDQSSREEPKTVGWQTPWDKGYIWAIDKNTGRERWSTKRGMSCVGHATPVVIRVKGKDQIISPTGGVIQAFDPTDGHLIWTVNSKGEPCVPSPAFANGLIFSCAAASEPIKAVRTDGLGDCTATHIAWEQPQNSPMVASFLYVKPCLYTCTDNSSIISCLNAETGEFLWDIKLRIGALNPSPLYADGKIYVLSEHGTTAVLKLSDDSTKPAEIIAKNKLEGLFRASIAVAGQQLIVRSDTHLFCIGK